MKKVGRVLLKCFIFFVKSAVLGVAMSGAEIAFNALKMAIQPVYYAATTLNRAETITIKNQLRYENLVKTNPFEVFAQAVLIMIAFSIVYAIYKRFFKKSRVVK